MTDPSTIRAWNINLPMAVSLPLLSCEFSYTEPLLTNPIYKDITPPSTQKLQNQDSPPYILRKDNLEFREEGIEFSVQEVGSTCVSVGHIYFCHSGPPLSLNKRYWRPRNFKAAYPAIPIILDEERKVERFHSVFATFAHKTDFAKVELEVGVDKDKNIKLFTVAVDHMNKAFHTDSQLKMEVRYYGVNIFDWRMVIFNTVCWHGNRCTG